MSGCILCGIDDPAGDRGAAAVASRLARDLHSHAVLLHVTAGARAFPHGLSPPRVGRDRKLRRQLRTVAEEQCFPEGTDLRVEAGDPVTRLIAVAEAEDAELICGESWRGSRRRHAGPPRNTPAAGSAA